ncbi:MAG: PNGase F N-terminal domain-containing protein [Candidatus Saccharimonadaceae bacterium]
MNKKILLTLIALSAVFLLNAQSKQGVVKNILSKTLINFDPSVYPNGLNEKDSIIYLGNGRIALTKVRLPNFKRSTTLNTKIKLVSNGDPWDKTGSCFIIPKESVINMMQVAQDKGMYPTPDSTLYENLTGIVQGDNYKPSVEIMRFMTPFGVGHYSAADNELSAKRKPVYIDGWANNVVWEEDVTDLLPLFDKEVYVGVFIDTWTKEGYTVDLELTYKESDLKCDVKTKKHVEPLINTVYYIGQKHPDIFARKDVKVPFTIPADAKNVRLKYITSGHGGHSDGDEFRPQENILSVDGNVEHSFTPWRTDCASFRRFNPSTGVWLKERTVAYISKEGRAEKQIEEPLASSDLSRSNWCPGSNVPPIEVPLNDIKAGKHTLTISIPDSKEIEGDKLNHWLVSAYLIWEKL